MILLAAAMGLIGTAQAMGQWSPVFASNGPNGTINAMLAAAAAPGEPVRLYVGGNFPGVTTPTGSMGSANLVAWDGQSWNPGPGLNSPVLDMTVHPFGGTPVLFLGASREVTNGAPLWRYSAGQWVPMSAGGQGYVFGLKSFDIGQGPRLVVSSPFFLPSAYVAQWNEGVLSAMGTGLLTVTKAFTVYDDGQGPRLFAGVGPETGGLQFISSFDGTAWSVPTAAPNQPVDVLKVFDDGMGPALYVAGDFMWVGPPYVQYSKIARYRHGAWSAVGTGMNGKVRTLEVFDDGAGPALYAAGDFTIAGGVPVSRIARWRGGQWSALDSGIAGGSVVTLAVFDDDGAGPHSPALYAAGAFTSAGGQPSFHVARWDAPAPCYANCDASAAAPLLTANDFQCFLNAFASGGAYANCDHSTAVPVLTANDFQCFLNSFANGCG